MLSLASLSTAEARTLKAFAFDLDDTLLDRGRLSEGAFSSLFRLKEAGLVLVAVTGRPSGWGEVIARQWPIDGAVTENGAVACALDGDRFQSFDFALDQRPARRARLEAIVDALRGRFPELVPSDDVAARRSDYTFDIGEHFRVPPDTVTAVRAAAHSLGARTVASSVHLHVTLDGLDKASGTVRFLSERLGWDPTESLRVTAFIGDSENDEACFSAFRTTFGVSNLRGRHTVPPRYLASRERGAGFAETANTLLSLRSIAEP
jgi:HAD superfamily hydrolase (TIGR01484 family)